MKKSHMKRAGTGDGKRAALWLLPSFLGVTIFVLIPFLDVIRRSFTTAVTSEFTGLDNYRKVFSNEAFRLAAVNTGRFIAVCLPLLLVLGLLLAMLLAGMKQAQLLKACFLFPMAMPAATIVLIWKMVFAPAGFLNRMMQTDLDFMGSAAAFWVLVFSYLWKNMGYTVVLWLAGLLGIPGDTIEAARVDGAGKLRIFFSVMLPQLKGTLYTITVLSFLNSFKVFREAYLVAGPYPDGSMYLLQHLFNNWFTYLELDKMAAAAVCIGIVLMAAILLLQKLWGEGGETE